MNAVERIYLDTNAFYFFFFESEEYSEGIGKIFTGIQKGRYSALTSAATLEELAYVTLMRLAEKKYRKHPAEVLRDNRQAIGEFAETLKEMFDVIFSLKNIEFCDVDRELAGLLPLVMSECLLLPQDSIHLQTMRRNDCKLIVSTDKDFDGVYGIKRIKPEEV